VSEQLEASLLEDPLLTADIEFLFEELEEELEPEEEQVEQGY